MRQHEEVADNPAQSIRFPFDGLKGGGIARRVTRLGERNLRSRARRPP